MKTLHLVLLSTFLFSCSTVSNTALKKERTIRTFIGMKQENVVMQKYDFSCGIASLMTLFQYHFGGDLLDEKKMLKDFLDSLPEKRKNDVIENGLSVLDLKSLSERLEYDVYAVTLRAESLLKLDRPILVYLENPDYKHFSVLRGVKNETVFLADSSMGKTRMSIPSFLKMWKGNIAIFLDAHRKGGSKLEISPDELEKPEIKLLQSIL